MNALFDEQNNIVVEYIGDASLPESNIEEISLHHESYNLLKLEKVISMIGGSVSGHHVLLTKNLSADYHQFELKEDKNV